MDARDAQYWSAKYKKGETGWDIGYPSTPIKEYLDQLSNKGLKILIPGAGNAYEGIYAYRSNFKNTYILDIAQEPLNAFEEKYPDFPREQILHENFFEHESQYDLIIEQTFFCAIDPKLRNQYAQRMQSLLKPQGKLVGLLFIFPLTKEGPPFGGSKEGYINLFSNYFSIDKLELAYNSIKPRMGNELFFKFSK